MLEEKDQEIVYLRNAGAGRAGGDDQGAGAAAGGTSSGVAGKKSGSCSGAGLVAND